MYQTILPTTTTKIINGKIVHINLFTSMRYDDLEKEKLLFCFYFHFSCTTAQFYIAYLVAREKYTPVMLVNNEERHKRYHEVLHLICQPKRQC